MLAEMYRLYGELLSEGKLPPIGYSERLVTHLVDITRDGSVRGYSYLAEMRERSLLPELKRSSSPVATICSDNLQYVLGVSKSDTTKDVELASRSNSAYLDCLRSAIADIQHSDPVATDQLRSILRFSQSSQDNLEELERRGLNLELDAAGTRQAANGLVRVLVEGEDPTARYAVRDWWALRVANEYGSSVEKPCQITHEVQSVAKKLPALRLRGNQPTLISANSAAAERYDATQASGAQLSVDAALKSHQALNWLLTSSAHHYVEGDVTYVWWQAESAGAFDPISLLLRPDPSAVKKRLMSITRTDNASQSVTPFHMLALSVNTARAVIRSDYTVALSVVDERISNWLKAIELTSKDGPWWPSVWQLAESVLPPGSGNARTKQRDRVKASLISSALFGQPIAAYVTSALVDRCRRDTNHITPIRAALLAIIRQQKGMSMVDAQAALCGRLFATLEGVQYSALGDVNRSIVDSFYASASVNPQRVFPKLLQGAQSHLRKVGRKNKGAEVNAEKRISSLVSDLAEAGGFPVSLNTAQQADFALGYWQEREMRFQKHVSSTDLEQADEENIDG